jgi:hypothetical protein
MSTSKLPTIKLSTSKLQSTKIWSLTNLTKQSQFSIGCRGTQA